MKNILTIAGSDSSGGAGIQADLKTFFAHDMYGLSVVTSITAQNTNGVLKTKDISASMVKAQLEAVFDDIRVDAIKIGMVSKKSTILEIVKILKNHLDIPVVLDTVMVSSSGFALLKDSALRVFIEELMPRATLVTPNIPEANKLLGVKISSVKDMKRAAKKICSSFKCQSVLLKGGHLEGDAVDVLYDGKKISTFKKRKINSNNTHGTGCALSSAIAVNLANKKCLQESIKNAKQFVRKTIKNGFSIGSGVGQLNHCYKRCRYE